MKWKRLGCATLALAALGALVVRPAVGAIVVIPEISASSLAGALISGSGFSVMAPTLTGAQNQQGTFSRGLTVGTPNGIGISTGVILSTGDARYAQEPNTDQGRTAQTDTGQSGLLSGLLGGATTADANILSFVFAPSSRGSLFFEYVFASEEHSVDSASNPFDDVFGLFLNNVNYALVPNSAGATTRVSVNTLNCGSPYNPSAGGPNCDLFVNNDIQSGSGPFDIQYDGFTKVLTATLPDLLPGQQYAISLAIADVQDASQDSAVFIAGRFEAARPNGIPEPGTVGLLSVGLLALLGAESRSRKSLAA